MHFTSNQKKAILFIAIAFFVAVLYHFLDKVLYPPEVYDFTQFEEKYYARLDSIKKELASDSAGLESGAILAGSKGGKRNVFISTDFKSPSKSTSPSKKKTLMPGQIININTASIDELTLLPRICPKTAAKIIEYRDLNGNFAAKKDITKVKGIGARMYEKLKDLIKVE